MDCIYPGVMIVLACIVLIAWLLRRNDDDQDPPYGAVTA